MKSLYKTGFLRIILALSFMGCSASGNSTIFSADEEIQETAVISQASLLSIPVHREYLLGAAFAKTEDHLSVFVVYGNGATQKIPLDEIQMTLDETLVDEAPLILERAGENQVALSYRDLSAQYTIVVRSSSTENPGGTSPTPQGGTTIDIDIQWK